MDDEDENTRRTVLAAEAAGLGLAGLNQLLLMLDLPHLNPTTWAAHV